MTLFAFCARNALRSRGMPVRFLSTLKENPSIYVLPNPQNPKNSHLLSLLPTDPPTVELALGTTTQLPPTPASFRENPAFLRLLQAVLTEHAASDPDVVSQAQVMASTAGANLGSGGIFFAPPSQRKRMRGRVPEADGGASSQGGVGSGGRGGFVHVSDTRSPPDFGRIAWPEDIFGSLEAGGNGLIEGNGNYQESGTYRPVTPNGILGLSPFLKNKVVERLHAEEAKLK